MKTLTTSERAIIDRILDSIGPRARAEFLEYRRTSGFRPATPSEIDLIESLHRKGWIAEPSSFIDLRPVWLTHEAWNFFALDEWQEIEDRIIETKRGEVSGSW